MDKQLQSTLVLVEVRWRCICTSTKTVSLNPACIWPGALRNRADSSNPLSTGSTVMPEILHQKQGGKRAVDGQSLSYYSSAFFFFFIVFCRLSDDILTN